MGVKGVEEGAGAGRGAGGGGTTLAGDDDVVLSSCRTIFSNLSTTSSLFLPRPEDVRLSALSCLDIPFDSPTVVVVADGRPCTLALFPGPTTGSSPPVLRPAPLRAAMRSLMLSCFGGGLIEGEGGEGMLAADREDDRGPLAAAGGGGGLEAAERERRIDSADLIRDRKEGEV